MAGDELADRLYIIDPRHSTITGAIAFRAGDRPGRMSDDRNGNVHVVLRGAGDLVLVDPRTAETLARTAVCPAPRGVAYDDMADVVHVACADGALVTLTTQHQPVRQLRLDTDLRDVVVLGDRLLVSRFRSAELLVLDRAGTLVRRTRPAERSWAGVDPPAVTEPHVAWRLRAVPGGVAMMVHQMHVATDLVDLASPPDAGVPSRESLYFPASRPDVPNHVVSPLITFFDAEGNAVRTASAAGLTVDADDYWGVHAQAGASFASRDRPICVAVAVLDAERTARLYQHDTRLVEIRREGSPSSYTYIDRPQPFTTADEGRRAFHTILGGRIVCASCHPEGGEDGHVWREPAGPRRTQTLQGGLSGTEPFHWGGELASLDAVLDLQATRLRSDLRVEGRVAMLRWLDALSFDPAASPPRSDAGAAFAAAGCSVCHAGPRFSDETNHDVGAGPVQTPRLGGVAYRGPWLHDGCARSLAQTLDGSCRDVELHGVADPEQRAEIVAYLRTL